MKRARIIESRVVGIPKEADTEIPVGDAISNYGICSAGDYRCKVKYGEQDASMSTGSYQCVTPEGGLRALARGIKRGATPWQI